MINSLNPSTLKKNLDNKYWLVIPAAGVGKRMGASLPKQYLTISGRSILELTIDRLSQLENIEKIVLVLHPEDRYWEKIEYRHEKLMTVMGGDERFNSVVNGLLALKDLAHKNDWVLVHDAVRPCVTLDDITRLMTVLQDDAVGGILAAPVKETLKKAVNPAGKKMFVESTLQRDEHWLAATPQMFRYELLYNAMNKYNTSTHSSGALRPMMTDEASVLEAQGYQVKIIAGRTDNIKITHPEDLPLADFILHHSATSYIRNND